MTGVQTCALPICPEFDDDEAQGDRDEGHDQRSAVGRRRLSLAGDRGALVELGSRCGGEGTRGGELAGCGRGSGGSAGGAHTPLLLGVDLLHALDPRRVGTVRGRQRGLGPAAVIEDDDLGAGEVQIGRASCRERVLYTV